LGYEVHRANARRTTIEEALRHLARRGFDPSTVIDVGAAYGTFEIYRTFPGAQHLLVEPLSEYEPFLRDISRRFQARYVIAAAGPGAGMLTINVHPDLVGSSLFHEADGADVDGLPREVPQQAIDALCAEAKLGGPYLIKVDVQGAELLVLDGAAQTLQETEVIILEVSLFQFFRDGPQLHDVVEYMRQRGFLVYDIVGGHNRPLDGALAQVDLVFVRENGRFRLEQGYGTEQQRKQLWKKWHKVRKRFARRGSAG
jgi:FkbM family methyltransferase